MKHLLTNSNKNNMSLVPSAEEDRAFDRQARKQGEKYGKNELKPSRERTELSFKRRENMLLLAPNVKYSIPVCKKNKSAGKMNWLQLRTENMLAPNVNKYWNLCKGEKRG